MGKNIVELQVRNRKDAAIVVGNYVLKPKSIQPGFVWIKILNDRQLELAYRAAVRDKMIEFHGSTPRTLFEKFEEQTVVESSEPPVDAKLITPPFLLTEEEITKMNGKELKATIAENELPIEGYQSLSVKDLKNELRAYFGLPIEE